MIDTQRVVLVLHEREEGRESVSHSEKERVGGDVTPNRPLERHTQSIKHAATERPASGHLWRDKWTALTWSLATPNLPLRPPPPPQPSPAYPAPHALRCAESHIGETRYTGTELPSILKMLTRALHTEHNNGHIAQGSTPFCMCKLRYWRRLFGNIRPISFTNPVRAACLEPSQI